MRSKSTSVLAIAAIFIATLIAAPLASVEGKKAKPLPDAGRGKQIAQRLCVNCHVISKDSTTTVPAGVPPFTVIANKPDQTANRIRAILIKPHPPMPNMHLTRVEINDIIAYLNELRDEKSGPPLLPNTKPPGPKMLYPDAS